MLGNLGRYTHCVALANSRMVRLDGGQVSFSWKDYRQGGNTKVMTLAADEFIRRFLQQTLSDGLYRIRHVNFLANRHCTAKLALCRDLLAARRPCGARPPRRRRLQRRERGQCGCAMREEAVPSGSVSSLRVLLPSIKRAAISCPTGPEVYEMIT